MHRTDHDFTTGSIPRHLIAFSWPLFAGNLLQAFYNVVDSIWVGHFVGANGLGAVSVSFPVIFALIALVVGLTMATTTLVAQFKGAGRHDMVRKVNGNSVLLLVYLGTLTTVVGLSVSGPLLRLINTPADIFPWHTILDCVPAGSAAHVYLQRGFGYLAGPGRFTHAVALSFLRHINQRDSRSRLDHRHRTDSGAGRGGAALATVIAQGVSTGSASGTSCAHGC